MKQQGHSLLEVLIAMGVMLLIVGALYQLFLGGLHLYARSQARIDIQSSGALGLLTLSRELRSSSLTTLTIQGNPAQGTIALAFRPPQSGFNTVQGFLPAHSFVIYYFNSSNNTVVRKTWGSKTDLALLKPANPFQPSAHLTVPQLLLICRTPNHTERPVASLVTSMVVQPAAYPDPALSNVAVEVTLTLQKHLNSTDLVTDTVDTTIALRNP